LVKTLQFIAATLVSTNHYRKGRKVAAKNRKESIIVLCVTLRNHSALCGLKKNKNFIFF